MNTATPFAYRKRELFIEGVALGQIAERYGTPCYVYSRQTIESAWRAYDLAFGNHPHLICYAVKANSNLAILNLLARLGSGFDIVSVGELERVLRAGGDPQKIVFAGVGKRADEMQRALAVGIRCFNVESADELERLNQVAMAAGVKAPVALRVNPDVDAQTHPYISTGLRQNKFGIPITKAYDLYRRAADLPGIAPLGAGCHIGSQLTTLTPIAAALERLLALVGRLAEAGVHLQHIDIGGGLGIHYKDEHIPSHGEYVNTLLAQCGALPYTVFIEPGRSIVGPSGALLTRIEYLKAGEERQFAIVDAAMNDLMRPALYDAWQAITPVLQHTDVSPQTYDIVGPICESGDFLGKTRELAVREGDLLAIAAAGAYGFSMSSTYNSRPRAAEVMVDGTESRLIRERETLDMLMAGEHLLPA